MDEYSQERTLAVENTDFDAIYAGESAFEADETKLGVIPWNIGEPQPVLVDLERSGRIRGDVLDAGCGLGENARAATPLQCNDAPSDRAGGPTPPILLFRRRARSLIRPLCRQLGQPARQPRRLLENHHYPADELHDHAHPRFSPSAAESERPGEGRPGLQSRRVDHRRAGPDDASDLAGACQANLARSSTANTVQLLPTCTVLAVFSSGHVLCGFPGSGFPRNDDDEMSVNS